MSDKKTEEIKLGAADQIVVGLTQFYNEPFTVTIKCVQDEKSGQVNVALVESFKTNE